MKSSGVNVLYNEISEMLDAAPRECIICGSDERQLLYEKEQWKIYECSICGLGILNPRPRKNCLALLYQKEYFADQYDSGVELDSPGFKRWMGLLEHRHRFFRQIKGKGKLLDIGCGNGYFLALCQRMGYEVQGIDLSPWAAEYASSKLGLNVISSEIGDTEFPPETFDIITMWHSLEHSEDPLETVIKVKQWLKHDGIFVIEVPNYTGTDAQHEWDHWIGWQIPYHLFHFTPKALAMLIEKYGFHIVKFKNFHSETVKNNLKRYPVISFFARIIAKFYSGHSIVVVARKSKKTD
jgi:2-polyprenyl-3-methyl-5-hydroxy-6-metoxy-1,4-benzoquinol methylase